MDLSSRLLAILLCLVPGCIRATRTVPKLTADVSEVDACARACTSTRGLERGCLRRQCPALVVSQDGSCQGMHSSSGLRFCAESQEFDLRRTLESAGWVAVAAITGTLALFWFNPELALVVIGY